MRRDYKSAWDAAIAAGTEHYNAHVSSVTANEGAQNGSRSILFHRIVPLFSDAALRQVEQLAGPPLRYPDGSLEFRIADRHANRMVVEAFSLQRIMSRISDTWMRNLAPFPEQHYTLYYGNDYQRLIGDARFHAVAGNMSWPGESRLEDLLFTVWFKRRPEKVVRGRFVRYLSDWLQRVSQVENSGGRGPAIRIPLSGEGD